MNDPAENPYAAPQSELGQTTAPRKSSISPSSRLWCLLIVLNAVAGMYLAWRYRVRSLPEWIAIVLGIGVVGLLYTTLERRLRRSGYELWAHAFFFGAILRIPFQAVLLFDILAGIASHSIITEVYKLVGISARDFEPGTAFLMTVFTGLQLAPMAVILGLIAAAIYQWWRR